MDNYFKKVQSYLHELNYVINYEDAIDGVFVISSGEDDGISNLVIGCAEPILIIEQFLVEISKPTSQVYKSLLKKNREIVHGAFVLDESATKVIFRDTLQIENLDKNELEGSINSLKMLLSEYSGDLIQIAKKQ